MCNRFSSFEEITASKNRGGFRVYLRILWLQVTYVFCPVRSWLFVTLFSFLLPPLLPTTCFCTRLYPPPLSENQSFLPFPSCLSFCYALRELTFDITTFLSLPDILLLPLEVNWTPVPHFSYGLHLEPTVRLGLFFLFTLILDISGPSRLLFLLLRIIFYIQAKIQVARDHVAAYFWGVDSVNMPRCWDIVCSRPSCLLI